jgi:hypothetical protein
MIIAFVDKLDSLLEIFSKNLDWLHTELNKAGSTFPEMVNPALFILDTLVWMQIMLLLAPDVRSAFNREHRSTKEQQLTDALLRKCSRHKKKSKKE